MLTGRGQQTFHPHLLQLDRLPWFAKLAAKFRERARQSRPIASRRRLGYEKLEDLTMMANDFEVGGMTLSVIDDLDPGYTESSFGVAKVVDNDSLSGFTKSPGFADRVIDNGDAYFAELGAGWTDSGLLGYDGDSRYSLAADAKARYTFTGLADGTYGVQIAVPGHSNSAQAKYTATSASGTTVIIQSYNQAGANGDFATIGSVIVTGGTLTIEVSRASSGSLRADAIRLQGIGWTQSGLGGVGDQQSSLYAYAAGATATYSFSDLSAKTHEIRVNTPAHENSTTSADYTVRSGGAIVGTFHLDQRPGTNGWKSLGFVDVPAGDLEITVSKTSGAGVLRVDAIQVREATGWLESGLPGHAGVNGVADSRYSYLGTASYAFGELSPGDVYKIYVKTPGSSNSTANAVYEIYSGGELLRTISNIDQTNPTAGQTGNVEGWLPIGLTPALPSSDVTVKVKRGDGSSGVIRGDAVAISKFASIGDISVTLALPDEENRNPLLLNGTQVVGLAVTAAYVQLESVDGRIEMPSSLGSDSQYALVFHIPDSLRIWANAERSIEILDGARVALPVDGAFEQRLYADPSHNEGAFQFSVSVAQIDPFLQEEATVETETQLLNWERLRTKSREFGTEQVRNVAENQIGSFIEREIFQAVRNKINDGYRTLEITDPDYVAKVGHLQQAESLLDMWRNQGAEVAGDLAFEITDQTFDWLLPNWGTAPRPVNDFLEALGSGGDNIGGIAPIISIGNAPDAGTISDAVDDVLNGDFDKLNALFDKPLDYVERLGVQVAIAQDFRTPAGRWFTPLRPGRVRLRIDWGRGS